VLDSPEAVSQLFEKTNRKELEQILRFLQELIDAIEHLYLNGTKPELGFSSDDQYAKEIRSSTKSVLGKVVAAMGKE